MIWLHSVVQKPPPSYIGQEPSKQNDQERVVSPHIVEKYAHQKNSIRRWIVNSSAVF